MESAEASLEFSDSKLFTKTSRGAKDATPVEEADGGSLVFAGSLQKDLEIPRATKFLHADHGPCNLRIPKTADIAKERIPQHGAR